MDRLTFEKMLRLLRLLFPCFLAAICPALQAQTRPNVVIFYVDDLGWTDLGCYGSDLYETPNIDRLAEAGVKFSQAYAACTVCSPSRAALMTGKHPARLHLTDWITGHRFPQAPLAPPDWTQYLPHEETTLAEHLREAGYATAHIGKWHLGEDSSYWPQHQGFDLNIAGHAKGRPQSYFAPYATGNWPAMPHLPDGPPGEYLTYRLDEEVVSYLRRQAVEEEPFFLYYAHYAVHTPLMAPDSLIDHYRDKVDSTGRHLNPTYAAMVHSVDQSLGRLRRTLEELGAWDRTLVIFASDNGGLIGRGPKKITNNAPLRDGKGTAYEGGVRTPLIIRFPQDQGAGQVSAAPAITMDLFATALDAAGLPSDQLAVDGQSLWVFRLGESPIAARRPLFWHYPHYHTEGATPYSAIRRGAYRLIEFYEDGRLELYHLEQDPGESQNLVATQPGRARRLHRELRRWRQQVGAQAPVKNPPRD